jgi:hypothetical protein
MEQIQTSILVFRTNLFTEESILQAGQVLDFEPCIIQWNVDRHDVDRVLRVVMDPPNPFRIIELMKTLGFACEELGD